MFIIFTSIVDFIIMLMKEVIEVIEKELEANKRYTDTMIKTYKAQKDSLEKTEEVKSYLEVTESLMKEQEFQKFLSQLEIGEDGTVFSPYEEYQDRALKNTHFGLSKALNFAIDLIRKYKGREIFEDDVEFYMLPYEQFQLYLDNAREILTDMNYVSGDRLFDNEYKYVIHQNPKNYSVVDFEKVFPLSKEKLEQNYDIFHVWVTLDKCFAIEQEMFDSLIVWESLTPREKEAFYGKKAKQILGLIPTKEKKRERVKN